MSHLRFSSYVNRCRHRKSPLTKPLKVLVLACPFPEHPGIWESSTRDSIFAGEALPSYLSIVYVHV